MRYVSADRFARATVREFLKWLDARGHALHRQLAATRRESSTQEVIEIAVGARSGKERS